MKKLSAKQLRLVVALNFVIICLLIGLLWIIPFIEPSQQTSGNTYSRARVGTISLNPYLGWELELLGSKEEEAVFSYEHNDILYVFGNTLSSDYDFDRPSIFLVTVDVFGKLGEDSFFNYGNEGDVLKSVNLCNDGFLLTVEGTDSPYLMTIGFDGSIIKKISSFVNFFERVDRLMMYHDGWLLFTRPFNTNQSSYGLRCVFFDRDLNFVLSSLAQSAYSLNTLEIVLFSSGPVVFCNAVNAFNVSYPAVTEFSFSASAKVTVLESYPGAAAGFSVHNGEYLLLTEYQGSSFIKLNARYEITWTQHLSLNSPLLFTDLDNGYYAAFYSAATYIFDSSLTRIQTLDGYTPYRHLYVNDSVIFSAVTGSNVCVISFNDGALKTHAPIGEGQKPLITIGKSTLYSIYNKNGNIIICTLRSV